MYIAGCKRQLSVEIVIRIKKSKVFTTEIWQNLRKVTLKQLGFRKKNEVRKVMQFYKMFERKLVPFDPLDVPLKYFEVLGCLGLNQVVRT